MQQRACRAERPENQAEPMDVLSHRAALPAKRASSPAMADASRAAHARGLTLGGRGADSSSMSPLPSLTASGLGLLDRADRRLAESARTFTRSAETGDASAAADVPAATATPETDVVDAAVGVIYGRNAFEIGVKLIEIGRDTEKLLLDVVA